MATAMIGIILVIICVFSVKGYIKRLRYGCCGGGQNEKEQKRIRVKDRDKSHYPYSASLEIDGMTCSRCAARVENSLNAIDGTWAKVNLEKKYALVRMKTRLDEDTIKQAVRDAGYIPMHVSYL